ncbi:MAG: WD40 repeat domain-containing protein [Nannocystaceae bacterium]
MVIKKTPPPRRLNNAVLPYATMCSAAFSPDGTQLVTGNTTGNLYLWDVASGELLSHGKTGGSDRMGIVYPSKTRFIAGSKTLHTFDAQSLKRIAKEPRYKGHKAPPNTLALAPNGRTLVSGGGGFIHTHDRFVRLWDVATGGPPRAKAKLARQVGASGVCFDPKGRWVATGGEDFRIRLHDPNDLTLLSDVEVAPRPEHGYPTLDSLVSDGNSLAVTDHNGRIFWLDTHDLTDVREIAPPTPQPGRPLEGASATGLCFAGSKLIIPRTYAYKDGYGGFLQVYDPKAGTIIRQHEAELVHVSQALICPNNRWYLVLSTQGALLWPIGDILGA